MKISANEIRQTGDAYFMALDALGCSTDIVVSCDLRQEVPVASLLHAYRTLLEQNIALQCVKHRDRRAGTWVWRHAPETVWRAQLDVLSALFATDNDPAGAMSVPAELPLRLVQCRCKHLVFRMDHTFANGKASYWWLEQYFHLLSEPDTQAPGSQRTHATHPGTCARASIGEAFWHVVANVRTRHAARREETDIRRPLLRQDRFPAFSFRSKRIVLPRSRVIDLISGQRKVGESFTQVLVRNLSEHVFKSHPQLRTVGIQVVADLHARCTVEHSSIGNFTGLANSYLDARKPLEAQISALFAHVRGEGVLGFIKVFSQLLGRQARMVDWFKNKFKLVVEGDGDLMLDHLLVVSNLGEVEGIHLGRWVEAISLHAITPHLYVSLSCINDSATFEFVYPTNIYDENAVECILQSFLVQFESLAQVNPESLQSGFMTPSGSKSAGVILADHSPQL